MAERLPEDIDAIRDLPLPRERDRLVAHRAAEDAVLAAYRSGRMHHAWLICGPQGIGKATLAFRIARFLLAEGRTAGADALSVPSDHPVARQVARLSHADLTVLRRGLTREGKVRGEISVEDARDLLHLFETTSAALGWRVAIVDAADDLNRHAANALLKMLEEPPPRAIFLIVAHAAERLLPTIRSRCRRLDLSPLGAVEMEDVVGELAPDADPAARADAIRRAAGSPRRALQLLDGDGIGLLAEVERLLEALPALDMRRAHALAERLSRRGAEGELELFRETIADWAAARVGEGARTGRPLAPLARLAETASAIAETHATADVFNLDRRQLVLGTFADLAEALGRRGAA